MTKPVGISFVEDLLAKAPKGQALIAMMAGGLYEIVGVNAGMLVVKKAGGFTIGSGEPQEIESREIANYWYISRDR